MVRLPLIQNGFAYFLQIALFLDFSARAQSASKAASYELTAYAGFDVMNCLLDEPKGDNSEGLTMHEFVKAGAPFSFIAQDGHGNHLTVSGTVREIDAEDFFLENAKLAGFGMSVDGGTYTSKETRELRKQLQNVLGPDSYNPSDPPEALGAVFCLSIGPGYRLSVKRLSSPQLVMVSTGSNVILTWPTNTAGFRVQSTTNLTSLSWSTNLPSSTVVGGQFTLTNPIAGQQRFFRLAQ